MASSIPVTLHYNTPTDPRTQSKPTPLDLARLRDTDLKAPLPKGISCFTTKENIFAYGFDAIVQPEGNVLLVQMTLPTYFNEIGGAGSGDLNGLFFVGLKDNESTPIAYNDKQHGSNGCPTLIYVGNMSQNTRSRGVPGYTQNRFTFNKMSFHPFIMIDMTIGFYVCDQGGVCDWPDDEPKQALAIDQPIVYDATLGLYVTRAAHLVDDTMLKKK